MVQPQTESLQGKSAMWKIFPKLIFDIAYNILSNPQLFKIDSNMNECLEAAF